MVTLENVSPAVHRCDPPTLVLASSSPYRRELLERLHVPFVWQAPAIDESAYPDEAPEALVRRLALTKAHCLAVDFPRHLIIGSDQVAVNAGAILAKPGNRKRAIAQLTAAAGRALCFLTSVCVLDSASGQHEVDVVSCEVVLRALSPAQIAAYIDLE